MAERRVAREQLKEGMLIVADIRNRDGLIIVPENTVVTRDVLNLLERHSIVEAIVREEKEDPELKEFTEQFHVVEETLSQSLRELAYQGKEIDIPQLLDMVDSLVAKTTGSANLCAMLFKMKRKSENLYAHSINVSLYAQILGKWIDCTEEEIDLVGIAGLLHDVGLLKCQEKVRDIPISFHCEFDNQMKLWEKHVLYGYDMIKNMNLDMRVKQAVLEHHERMDMTGFPHKLSYNNIGKLSRILAIADAYDTLTMEEKDYEAYSPFEALRQLHHYSYIKLDANMLMAFIEQMAQAFIQYEVLLSNGQMGRVLMINRQDQARPLVQVGDSFVDLSKQTDITIKKVLN